MIMDFLLILGLLPFFSCLLTTYYFTLSMQLHNVMIFNVSLMTLAWNSCDRNMNLQKITFIEEYSRYPAGLSVS